MRWATCRITDFSEQALSQAYASLSPTRKAHIDSFRKKEDKVRSLSGELLVQKLLAEEFGISDAKLHRQKSGQPYLTGCNLFVSISHSDDMVACAISNAPVGIDIQKIRPISPDLIRHLCAPAEGEYVLQGISETEILHRLYEIWTAKEAWFKKQGTGITDLKSVNILPLPRQIHLIDDYLMQIL